VNRAPLAVLLDTNILLLWLVGNTDAALLLTFKRVQSFEERDLVLLERLLRPFQRMITTPHILTEVSNFVDQSPMYKRARLVESLREFIQDHAEIYESAVTLVDRSEFNSLGLSDTALVSLSADAVIITTDFHLSERIASQGGQAINFNRARSSYLVPATRLS